jgi:dTDP-4-amino-4,6-dideoxyglucose
MMRGWFFKERHFFRMSGSFSSLSLIHFTHLSDPVSRNLASGIGAANDKAEQTTMLRKSYCEGKPVFSTPMNIVRPVFPPIESFQAQFASALQSGQVTNNGPWVVEFERQLEAYLGAPTLVFSSGQSALMTMVKAAGIEGGEVVLPSFTFPGTLHAVTWCGATPVFAEIRNDQSFVLDPGDVERKITDRTVAVLGVDAYGIASDYEALDKLGARHGISVLYDSAPAFGTRVNGRSIGGYGDAQIFSFHASKAFNTMEGGCLCSHDDVLIERARSVRNFGLIASGDSPFTGMNGKMMEVCALIGIEQLKTFDVAAAVRRRSAERIRHGLEKLPGLKIGQAPANQEPIWLYLPVVVDSAELGCNRDQLAERLARENLLVRKYYSPPCHHLSAYTSVGAKLSLPVTEHAAYNVLALPIYNNMTDDECDGIVEAFARIHARLSRE